MIRVETPTPDLTPPYASPTPRLLLQSRARRQAVVFSFHRSHLDSRRSPPIAARQSRASWQLRLRRRPPPLAVSQQAAGCLAARIIFWPFPCAPTPSGAQNLLAPGIVFPVLTRIRVLHPIRASSSELDSMELGFCVESQARSPQRSLCGEEGSFSTTPSCTCCSDPPV